MSIKALFFLIFSIQLTFFSASLQAQQWPEIDLQSEFTNTQTTGESITITKDPVYQNKKRYQAYPLRPIVAKLAEQFSGDLERAVLVFTALDGYKVSMAYPDALQESGYLAFRDLDAQQSDWINFQFGREKITPSPFYLVWTNPGVDKWRFPWPFQLKRISLQPAEIYFGSAAPLEKNATVSKGFADFNRYCIRCHSINGSGGKVGPELNTPSNVSELYSDKTLRNLILDNSKYRPNSKMPVFADILRAPQVDGILAYLKAMKAHKTSIDESN